MRYLACLFLLTMSCWPTASPQSTRKIHELEKQQTELRRQITESETLLTSTKKDVKSQLSNLALLSGQIEERKKYLTTVERDVRTVQAEIVRVEKELGRLQKELAEARKKYDKSVNYMYRNRSIQEKLMFIFSAETLGQMYRRMRYVRQYADYQQRQGRQVEKKQVEVKEKKEQLTASRQAKENLLNEAQTAARKLEEQEKEKKEVLASLRKKQKGIQNELNRQRRTADQLNKEIDRLIAIEIEKARKRAEEERKRKEAEARRAAEAAKAAEAERLAKSAKPSGKTESTRTETREAERATATRKPASVPKMEAYKTDAEDRRLSSVFENNKGQLPIPITGPYVIVGHYGQYQVAGLKHVRLDNKGVDIKGKSGAMARCIFDGEVSAIFQYNGLSNVIVRHGSYISVYCNLSHVQICKGSLLKARDVIGSVHTDVEGNTVLHFQLRKETAKLNPELWLRK